MRRRSLRRKQRRVGRISSIKHNVHLKVELTGLNPNLLTFIGIYKKGKYAGHIEVSRYGEDLRIEQLYIHPEFRRQKIGTEAIRQLEKFARRAGFKRIVIEDISGTDFWEKLGYKGKYFKAKVIKG